MATDYRQLVLDKATQYGIDPGVALAQIQRESGFNPRAVGSSGERGLGQFMPGTWQRFGSGSFDNAFDPVMNLDAWGKYMSFLLTTFGGDYASALTGYNGGEGHLLNPGKYGPPSAAAISYGQALAAQASGGSSGAYDPIFVIPGAESSMPWLFIGGIAAVLIYFAVRD